MARFFWLLFSLFATRAYAQDNAQNKLANLVTAAYEAHHFNGTVLVVTDDRISQVSRGEANFQFGVPLTADTRFPIASMTKLFTAILTLQLVEKSELGLDTKVSTYLPDLPAPCQAITVGDLLAHRSGLKNEPLRAYKALYSPAEFIKNFVRKDERKPEGSFNYNNVDYIILTRLLEIVTRQSFARLVQASIID